MVYLLFAVISSTMVSVCMRISEKTVGNSMAMFTANYAVCFMISRFYMGNIRLFSWEAGMGTAVGLGVVSGFFYLAGFLLFRQSIRYNGVVLSSASMKLGAVLIPVLAAVLLFRERIGGPRLWGFLLAVLAILLISVEKQDLHRGGKKLWLMVLLAVNGVCDTMANLYQKIGIEALKDHYLADTFLTAFFLALLTALWKRERVRPADILWGAVIGVPNYYSARFVLLALGEVPAVIVYPVYSVGTIIAITLIGLTVFRERLSRQKIGALGLILAALLLLELP